MSAKLPEQTELAIVDRYRAGASMAQVAELEHVALTTVHRVLRRRGVRSRGHGTRQLSHDAYERTIALYRMGLTSDEVGRLLGLTGAGVRRRLELAGVPRRKAGAPSVNAPTPRKQG